MLENTVWPNGLNGEMALSIPIPLALGRFKQLPQRSGEVWQGGLVRLPAWIDHPTDPEGDPSRPMGALWVSTRTGSIHLAVPDERVPATPEFALAALLEFGLKGSKGVDGRPSRVEVQDAVLKDALAEHLSRLATPIDVVADMPAVREAMRELELEANDGRRLPGALEVPGVTPDRMRAFAAAAARFYDARPWDHLTNEDLIAVEGSPAAHGMCTFPCSVTAGRVWRRASNRVGVRPLRQFGADSRHRRTGQTG